MDNPDVHYIYLEPFFPHFDNCCICEVEVQRYAWRPNYGIPMYEGIPVPPEWKGEWGGFTACKSCHDKYDRRELEMWDINDLAWVTNPFPDTTNWPKLS